MRKIVVLFAFLQTLSPLLAQVGIGTSTPNASSVLDLTATDKGLLTPRLTQVQRDAIASPANGLLVFNTTTNKFNVYVSGAWVEILSGSVPGDNLGNHQATQNIDLSTFQLVGNSGTFGIAIENNGNVGIGTTGATQKLVVMGADAARIQVSSSSTNFGPGISINSTGAGGKDWKLISNQAGNVPGAGVFSINDGNTIRLTIDNTGNVGIGQITPKSMLHLSSYYHMFELDFGAEKYDAQTFNTFWDGTTLRNQIAGNATYTLWGVDNGNSVWSLNHYDGLAANADLLATPPNSRMNFRSGGLGINADNANGAGLRVVSKSATNTIFERSDDGTMEPILAIESNSGSFVNITTPTSIASTYTLTLPTSAGSNGQTLTTDGAGNLSWSSSAGDNLGNHTATAKILALSGTAIDPGYSFISDINTGIFNPAANEFAISTDGAERMRINSFGNVGFGTNNPTRPLQVHTISGMHGLSHTDGTIELDSYIGGGEALFGTVTNHPLGLYTNNSTPSLYLNTTGSVGVGTSGPSTKFHVKLQDGGINQTTTVSTFTHSTSGTATAGIGTKIGFETQNGAGNSFYGAYTGMTATDVTNGAETADMFFSTRNAGTSAEKVRITGAGNVGIGVTNPAQKLDVLGNVQILSGASGTPAALVMGRTLGDGDLGVAGNPADFSNFSSIGDVVLRSNTNNLILAARNGSGNIYFSSGAGDSPKMTVLNGGNVGVGTSTPTEKFEIRNGNVLLSSTTANPNELRLEEGTTTGGDHYTSFKAGDQASNIVYVLPTAQGSANTFLSNDGAGNLAWTNITGESTTASNGLTKIGDDIQLGGTLSSNTTINNNSNQLYVNGDGMNVMAINSSSSIPASSTLGIDHSGTASDSRALTVYNTNTNGSGSASNIGVTASTYGTLSGTYSSNYGVNAYAANAQLNYGVYSRANNGVELNAAFAGLVDVNAATGNVGLIAQITNSGTFFNPAGNHAIYTDAQGIGNAAVFMGGNVGIKNATPNAAIQVNGDISLNDNNYSSAPNRIIGFPTRYVGNHGSLTIQAQSNPGNPFAHSGGDLILAGGDFNVSGAGGPYGGNVIIKSGGNIFDGSGGSDIIFQGGGSTVERMRLEGMTGDLGIGTANPIMRLDVQGGTAAIQGIGNDYSESTFQDYNGMVLHTYNQGGIGSFAKIIATGADAGCWGSHLSLYTRPDGCATNVQERMRILPSGNVGIAAANPVGKLSVEMGSATSAGNVGAWDNTYAIFGSTQSGNGSAVGIGFASGTGGVLTSLTPGVVWENMTYLANAHIFKYGGSELMRILNTGQVSIGTATPSGLTNLHVVQPNAPNYAIYGENIYSGNVDGVGIHGYANNASNYGIGGRFTGGFRGVEGYANLYTNLGVGGWFHGNAYGVYANATGSAGGTTFGVFATASGGTNNWAIYSSGNQFSTSGAAWTVSDQNFKSNIMPLHNALAIVTQLEAKTYEYNQEFTKKGLNLPEGLQYGFLAQDVEKVLPESVKDTQLPLVTADPKEKETKYIPAKIYNPGAMVPLAIQSIKELNEKIKTLEQENQELKSKYDELLKRVEKLEKK